MSIRIGVLSEKSPGENRVALIPEMAQKLIEKGFEILIESGAGQRASFFDEAYLKAGAKIERDITTVLKNIDILLKVQMPEEKEIEPLKENAIVIGILSPYRFLERIQFLQKRKITSFAMELIPRVTRAQSMDALSSQSTVAGYKAVLIAANLTGRFFPMLTTAAGTIRPVRMLILGAGVAGLQAIATARRLGAVVEAYDVRPAVKEQVESLGARFLSTPVDAEAHGGYARELTIEEKKKEKMMLAEHIGNADVVITTAQIPGLKAPILITEEMVNKMKSGSIIVDIAAEGGGNCELTKAGELVEKNGVKIFGPVNLPSLLPAHASEMYAKNLYYLLLHLTKEGKSLDLNWQDEIISGSVLTHAGEIKHAATQKRVAERLK